MKNQLLKLNQRRVNGNLVPKNNTQRKTQILQGKSCQ